MLFGTFGKRKFPFAKRDIQVIMNDKYLISLGGWKVVEDFLNDLTG